MLITNHVLQGALLGRAVRRPLPALVVGAVSHLVADALPHWGDIHAQVHEAAFLRVAVPDGLAGLALLTAVARATPPTARPAVVAGMVGACLPDLDKPWALVVRRAGPWPAAFDRLHRAVQREAAHRLPLEVALAGALALAVAAVHRLSGLAAERRG